MSIISCSNPKNGIKSSSEELYCLESLNHFRDCSSLISSLDTSRFASKILQATWAHRNLDYKMAINVLDPLSSEIEDYDTEDPFIRLFIETLTDSYRLLNNSESISQIKKWLNIVDFKKSPDLFLDIQCKLSDILLRQGNQKMGLALSKDAADQGIKNQLDSNSLSKILFFHYCNLERESINESKYYYLNKAIELTPSFHHPLRRMLYVYSPTFQSVQNPMQLDSNFLHSILNSDQYSPKTDISIWTMLDLCFEQDEVMQKLKEKLVRPSLNNPCNTTYWPTYYNIFRLIDEQQLKEANALLKVLKTCPELQLNAMKRFDMHRIHSNLEFQKFKISHEMSNLIEARNQLIAAQELFCKELDQISLMHYADFFAESHQQQMEYAFQLQKLQSLSLDDLLMIMNLGKIAQSKIINEGVTLYSKTDNEKYKTIINQIDSLELVVNLYNDTTGLFIVQHEKLKNLYLAKLALESKHNVSPEHGIESGLDAQQFQDLLRIKNAQYIDFTIMDSLLYVSCIRPDRFFIKKYTDSLILKELSLFNQDIRSKKSLQIVQLERIMEDILDPKLEHVYITGDLEFSSFPYETLIYKDQYILENFIPTFIPGYYSLICNNALSRAQHLFSFSSEETIASKERRSVTELQIGLKEVESIHQMGSKSTMHTGTNFNTKNLISCPKKGVLHLSTHSNSNVNNFLENYIYIRDQNGRAKKYYGFEVKRDDVYADLVILSSCDSGTGAHMPGTGALSLSRYFMNNGAKTTIKSLWAVGEHSTYLLMKHFYSYLENGFSVGKSLQMAKIDLLQSKNYANPYYWAGFVIEGNPHLKYSE